jgi:tetratricopeptide (TPR) repeat protein
MSLLIQGLSLDPTSPMLLDQFWKLAIKDLGQDPNQILKLRVMGANTNVLEAMSGLQSLQNGDIENATESFRSALKKSPDLAILLNNLSTIGELRSEKNSDISVKLLNILVEISPKNANIRENRGMILIRNKQFTEGIKDLESILTDSNNLKEVHLALSDAYSELGNREKADFHKVAAEKIDKPNLAQKNENADEEKNDKPAA